MPESQLLFPKLVVFGASGRTGHQVVQQALAKGHSVTAVVRSPETFYIKDGSLEVVKGDVFDPEFLATVLKGKDAVISCLGFSGSFFWPTTLYSKSITSITTAMERSGIGKLVCVTCIYTQKDPSNPRWMDWLLRPLARSFMNDMALMEDIVMKSNHLCYTIVRPPCLSEEPATANYLLAEGQSVPEGVKTVPRADLAHFMLKSLDTKEWDKKGVAIDAKKKQ
ncbi:hypothetical protein ACROYT_G021948 [Oculina patagonica]